LHDVDQLLFLKTVRCGIDAPPAESPEQVADAFP
jgi:hypothetical protein